jgi:hypothetical protein
MMSTKTMTTDQQLTEMCRLIFGDIVARATCQTEDNIEYEREPRIEFNCKGDLDWSDEEFVVEFINGVKVKFWNSEWAYLTRLDR